jgi:hypothetical protein
MASGLMMLKVRCEDTTVSWVFLIDVSVACGPLLERPAQWFGYVLPVMLYQ